MNLKERLKSLPVSSKRTLGLGVVLALLVALPLFVWGILTQTLEIREKADVVRVMVPVDGEPFLGPVDAPVTIVEYGDLQCPFCKDFAENTLSQIRAAYPTQVKLVYKDFPLTGIHPLALDAAIAGQCSFAQNKFWEMHDLIYANQDTLSEQSFASFSAQLNLNQNTFDQCYAAQIPLAEVNQDLAEGQDLGVVGTPTFFVNGIRVDGAQPFSVFQSLIESELNPTPSPTPTGGDDVFFKSEGNSVVFTTTDQTPNVSIAPEDLINGKTYVLQVIYSLQNNIKSQEATTSGIPVIVLIDNVYKSSKDIPYSLIAVHQDGASDIQTASFVAQDSGTALSVSFDPNNIFPETNETNNILTFNFPRATPTPTATATPTPYVPGEPNYCNGTCGSHENCQANYFCYQGFCRNPLCPNDSACGCATPTPTAKLKVVKASPTMAVIKLTPMPSPTVSPTPYEMPTAIPLATSETPNKFNFLLYVAGGSFLLALLLLGISKIKPPTSNY